jgi:hypothetical protein
MECCSLSKSKVTPGDNFCQGYAVGGTFEDLRVRS